MALFGVSTALLTPFDGTGAMNLALLSSHAGAMLAAGANGVTLFGTTGEGASIAMTEREAGIGTLLQAGVPASRITLGICATALGDAEAQVAQGIALGISDFLLLPPFYFKGNCDAGLRAWHGALLSAADPAARFILYHIPQVSGVGLSPGLVGRIVADHGERVFAIKDSSGDWENSMALLGLGTVTVLIGDERQLHLAAARGAGGAISGMANLYPERVRRIVETATEDAALNEDVDRVVSVPVVPAIKSLLAQRSGEQGWMHLRPPLMPLDDAARAMLVPTNATEA